MPVDPTPLDRSALVLARNAVTDRQAALTAAIRAQRSGGGTAAAAGVTAAQRALAGARAQLSDRQHELVPALSETAAVATLSAALPIALLPVRIETRYALPPMTLRIRIFPDQIHLDLVDPALTDDELKAAHEYWHLRWAAGADADAAWRDLVGTGDPLRSAYAARRLTPTNLAADLGSERPPVFPQVARRADTQNAAPRARALPSRFAAVGLQGGKRIFTKWGSPVSDALEVWLSSDTPDTSPDGEMPLADEMRWMVDYASAEAAGMAITVTADDVTGGAAALGGTLDRLIVIGVDWTLTPDAASQELDQLVQAHAVSDGIGYLTPGTPTNNTADTRPPAADRATRAAALDPTAAPADAASDAAALAQALGATTGTLTALPNAALRDAGLAGKLIDAVWNSVPGVFLEQFFINHLADSDIGQVRDHAVAHLRPGGPLPVLHIGRQPYGVLPVMVADRYVPRAGDAHDAAKLHLLQTFRKFHWSTLEVGQIGRARAGGVAIDDDLKQVLNLTPWSVSARVRHLFGPAEQSSTNPDLVAEALSHLQYAMWEVLFENATGLAGSFGPSISIGNLSRPELANYRLAPQAPQLRMPFVQAGPLVAETAWTTPYIAAIAAAARRGDSGTVELNQRCNRGETLLEVLLAQAALVARAKTHSRFTETVAGVSIATAARDMLVTPDIVLPAVPSAGTAQIRTAQEVSWLVVTPVTGTQTVAEFTAAALSSAHLPAWLAPAELPRFLAAIDTLTGATPFELDRLLRGLLDGFGHRLDAWFTALATARLAEMRAATPAGVHLGAFGWVEALKPDTAPDSMGYLPAPSLHHAATAALLRSGYLSHGTADGPFNIDLSSDRVRLAEHLLAGVEQVQSVAALLGYRFERGLRDRGAAFARFILPLRLGFPLRPTGGAIDPNQPLESIGARDVVDGLQLVTAFRAKPDDALAPTANPNLHRTDAERAGLLDEMRRLDLALDAVADLMLAETVHQLVGGNVARAGAAVAALDRGEPAPERTVVQTPRSSLSFTQRLLLLQGDDPVAAAWAAVSGDPMALAEPRLNAWIATLLGDPARVLLSAAVGARADAADAGTPPQVLTCSLLDLGLSPLALVMAAIPRDAGRPTGVEQRLANHFWSIDPGTAVDRTLVLSEDPPAGSPPDSVGLGSLLVLLSWTRTLLTGKRAADNRDFFAGPGDDGRCQIDLAELTARADAAAVAQATALAALDALLTPDASKSLAASAIAAFDTTAQGQGDPGPPGAACLALLDGFRQALQGAAALGTAGALPDVVTPPGFVPQPHDARDMLDVLLTQATGARSRLAAQVTRLLAAETAFAPDPAATPEQATLAQVAHQVERLRLVLGSDFPVAPVFTLTAAAAITASSTEIVAADTTAPRAWLGEMSATRPGVTELQRVLASAEMLAPDDTPAAAPVLAVCQLPHVPGQAWAALAGPGAFAPSALSIVTCGSAVFTGPVAGLMLDAWVEAVPDDRHTAAAAFHYDAPGARPPQTILLATPPDRAATGWSFDTLVDTVTEAADLARLRLVGPNEMRGAGSVMFPASVLPSGSLHALLPRIDFAALLEKFSVSIAERVQGR